MDGFTEAPPEALIEESVTWVEKYAAHLTEQQRARLRACLVIGEADRDDDATIDIHQEVKMLMRALRGLRQNVMTDNGVMVNNADPKDAKEVIASTTNLLSLLMRSQEKIVNMGRLRAIEEAAVKAVRTLPEAQQEAFFGLLEQRLGKVA